MLVLARKANISAEIDKKKKQWTHVKLTVLKWKREVKRKKEKENRVIFEKETISMQTRSVCARRQSCAKSVRYFVFKNKHCRRYIAEYDDASIILATSTNPIGKIEFGDKFLNEITYSLVKRIVCGQFNYYCLISFERIFDNMKNNKFFRVVFVNGRIGWCHQCCCLLVRSNSQKQHQKPESINTFDSTLPKKKHNNSNTNNRSKWPSINSWLWYLIHSQAPIKWRHAHKLMV